MLLSVVSPVYNEEIGVDHLISQVIEALSERSGPWEMIVVNDGSRDGTLEKLLVWHQRDSRIKVLDLTRNFGHQRALLAGLAHASGEVIACIDGDLQDPPELIPVMLRELDKHHADVVYGVRRHRKENIIKKTSYWLAYRVMRAVMEIELPLDSGDFAVMRRPVMDAFMQMPEQSLFLRGLRAWVGFRQIPFPYERAARFAGDAKYTWKDLFRLAYSGIFSFTKLPIRLMGLLGMGAIGISVLYSIFLLAAWMAGRSIPQGFTTIVLAIIFFSGVQLLALRILGAYIHRIYDEVRARPPYLIRAFWNNESTQP
jgi:dolichol-phosphate mannosyltransferase